MRSWNCVEPAPGFHEKRVDPDRGDADGVVRDGGVKVPVPVSLIDSVLLGTFRSLFVRTARLLKEPVAVGLKSNAMVQLVPPAIAKAWEEDGVVCKHVEELSQAKFAGTLGLVPDTGNGKVRVALPSLLTVTVRGLSVLVEPTRVLAKARVGWPA
jgi:hypothetical protein